MDTEIDEISFKKGQLDIYEFIDSILTETGGVDANTDYYKGWDAAINEVERQIDLGRETDKL